MKEQLDQLENSVMRLLVAYADLKKENDALKLALTEKESAVSSLQGQTTEVRARIDQLIATLDSDLPQA